MKIWDIKSGKIIQNLEKHKESVYCVRFSRSGNYLASCSRDKTIMIWDTRVVNENIEMINHLQGHSKVVTSIDFSNDEKFIVSGSEDTKIKVFDIKTGVEVLNIEAHTDYV